METRLRLIDALLQEAGWNPKSEAVREAFVEIERTYRLSDIQIKFLQEILDSISQRGILDLGDLYDGKQFKSIHDGGIEAVFESEVTDRVFDIVKRINQGVG